MHFPDELSIKSYGSGYGGNALLGKKCHALRIASAPGAQRGLAGRTHADRRHREPAGRDALHRRCVPARLRQDQPRDADSAGRLSARRLEGLDGRRRHLLDAPRRGWTPVRDQSRSRFLRRGARHQRRRPIPTRWRASRTTPSFTNVARHGRQPAVVGRFARGAPITDWQGRAYDPANGPAAHPNSRFTVSARSSARPGRRWPKTAQGVPISAIVFGGRRASLLPLVYRGARLGTRRADRRGDGARKPPLPPPVRSACCVATRWR